MLSPGASREDMLCKGNLDPVGPSFVKTLSGSSLNTYNLKLQIKETLEIHRIFFQKLGFLDIKARTALKKTIKNNSERARWSSRRRRPLRRREARQSVSAALWEGGAPHWITLLKTQIRPDVLVVCSYLYMATLVFGGGPLGVLSKLLSTVIVS